MIAARTLSPVIFLILLLASLGYVLWRGEKAERAGVSAIAIGSVLSALAASSAGMWRHGEIGIFLVDVALLFALIVITGYSKRFWPPWLTAFQIVAVATHIARFLRPNTLPMAYAVAEQLWVVPMQLILVSVVYRHHCERSATKSPY